jgi:hypothetical protein
MTLPSFEASPKIVFDVFNLSCVEKMDPLDPEFVLEHTGRYIVGEGVPAYQQDQFL